MEALIERHRIADARHLELLRQAADLSAQTDRLKFEVPITIRPNGTRGGFYELTGRDGPKDIALIRAGIIDMHERVPVGTGWLSACPGAEAAIASVLAVLRIALGS